MGVQKILQQLLGTQDTTLFDKYLYHKKISVLSLKVSNFRVKVALQQFA